MKWTIIHPSRGRCQKAFEAAESCINNFDSSVDTLEYIVSIDTDDAEQTCYAQWCVPSGITLIINDNRSLVDACNNAAKIASGDCFLVLSDDFLTPRHWNELLKLKIDRDMYGILVNDGISDGDIMSLPIMSKSLYERIGYIYHPEFFSLFADNALLDVVKKLDCLIDCRHLLFEHMHYIVGKAPKDATYERENSHYAYTSGKMIYDKLKKRGYDL